MIAQRVIIDKHFSVLMSLDERTGAFFAQWAPNIPRSLTHHQLNAFMNGRNSLIAEARKAHAAITLVAYRKSTWKEQETCRGHSR